MTAVSAPAWSFRHATPEDALCLGVLGTQVFLETYAPDGVRPALAREVLGYFSTDSMATLLADPSTRFIVAEQAEHLVGFAQLRIGAIQAQVAARPACELHRLYVLQRFTGVGIGTALLGRAEGLAESLGAAVLWLTAWVGNERARGFYARNAYADIGSTIYELQDERYENRLFVKDLTRPFHPQQEKTMSKGYWIARVDVSDPEQYKAYVAANAVPFAKYGARFLVRAGRFETPEGISRGRNVVIEFADYQTALDCWHSPEYQAAIKLRAHVSTVDMVIIEGYDGPQPG